LCNTGEELDKSGRKALLILIALGIVIKTGIKGAVKDKSAAVAKSHGDILPLDGHGLPVIPDGHQAVNRGLPDCEKIFNISVSAVWTGSVFHWVVHLLVEGIQVKIGMAQVFFGDNLYLNGPLYVKCGIVKTDPPF